MARICSSCHTAMADAEGLVLWDGRLYCPRCLAGLPESVLDYFRDYATFDEYYEPEGVLRCTVGGLAIWGAILSLALSLGLALEGTPIAVPLLVFLVIYGVAGVLEGLGHFTAARCGAHHILIAQGQVEVRAYFGRRVTVALESIGWYIGTTKDDTCFGSLTHRPRRAIVLVIAPARGWRPPCRVCCGMSEESFAALEAFLRLAGVPRVQ